MYYLEYTPVVNANVIQGEILNSTLSIFGLGATGKVNYTPAQYSLLPGVTQFQKIKNHTLGTFGK